MIAIAAMSPADIVALIVAVLPSSPNPVAFVLLWFVMLRFMVVSRAV
jgi:hypothetical protein